MTVETERAEVFACTKARGVESHLLKYHIRMRLAKEVCGCKGQSNSRYCYPDLSIADIDFLKPECFEEALGGQN